MPMQRIKTLIDGTSALGAKVLERTLFLQQGEFCYVNVYDFETADVEELARLLETGGWQCLTVQPDLLIVFASSDKTVVNWDIDGQDTSIIASAFEENGWNVTIISQDPGHIQAKRSDRV